MKRSPMLNDYTICIDGKCYSWSEFKHSKEFREIQEDKEAKEIEEVSKAFYEFVKPADKRAGLIK